MPMPSEAEHPKPCSRLHFIAVALTAASAAVVAIVDAANPTIPYISPYDWIVFAGAAVALALLPKRGLKGVAPLYGTVALCWAAFYHYLAYTLTSVGYYTLEYTGIIDSPSANSVHDGWR
jgi:hypothetical protein